MPSIVSKTVVGPSPGEYYSTLVTNGISYEDGSPVTVQDRLYVKFLAPPSTGVPQLTALLSPWQKVDAIFTLEPMADKSVAVTAELPIAGPYRFNASDTLTWGINGDLRGDASRYTESFELFADKLPSGTVEAVVPGAPDGALSTSMQTITLSKGGVPLSLLAPPGETTPFEVATGDYTVKVDDLINENETIVATASVSPTEITVKDDATTTLTVSYGTPQKFSALDIKVGQLSSPLDKEQLHVQVKVGGGEVKVFDSPNNHTTSVRRLPPSGTATVIATLTLNNIKYTSQQPVELSNALINVDIEDGNISSANIDTSSFVDLPIKVNTDLEPSDESIALRLVSRDQTAFIYSKEVPVESGTITLGPVAPGRYKVSAPGYIKDGTVYGAHVVSEIEVASDGSSKIDMEVLRGPKLAVRGFPDYLSFGAISDLVDPDGKDLTAAKVTSVFKYAGTDGAGDAGAYLDDDPATTRTVGLASRVSENLDGQSVLPVMISYTVNLSLGDSERLLQSVPRLEHSFGNLILSMQLARKASQNQVPAGYIVNPDFLGANQQEGRGPSYIMPVREPLTNALAHRNIDAVVPETVKDTLAGYVQAVNWLIRTVAPEVTFGWQANLWGVGSSAWIYKQDDNTVSITNAKSTADYIRALGVHEGEYAPDFLAIDRYEADDFTYRGYGKGYCYGPREWARFYDFVRSVALELKVPVMPWQVPASRVPRAAGDAVTADSLEPDHWGTGGTYVFGDAGVGSGLQDIHPVVLGIELASDLIPHEDVESLFESAEPFDLGAPSWGDFPLRGIFSVLLGGGSTTGVVTSIGTTGKWTQEKIREYMENPTFF
ncbi:hypothetical protein INS49_015165 [Diaporthe citri]|uniref:uncharacterized protein n=1 Tax=Diaporthe citri TaxID=83186 RepID=UPI001C81C4CE|nr:uncharacterized protein INS49_015165 [Diaporthe citri]KAG6357287.1 hypothetical protein INS49_015165 [Diaporthe citri]